MKKYGFSAAVGAALFVFAAAAGLSGTRTEAGNALAQSLILLSDACLLPGVLLLSAGGLAFVSGTGMFDVISYTLSLLTGGGTGYYEYKCERKKRKRNPAPTLCVGVGFLLVSILFGTVYCLIT